MAHRNDGPETAAGLIMGFTNATFGMFAGFAVVTMPQMLTAQGIPGGHIAEITAAVLSPGFWVFLLAPALDVRFSRRAYALAFSLLAALALAWTTMHRANPSVVEATMMCGYIASSLVQGGRRMDGQPGPQARRQPPRRLVHHRQPWLRRRFPRPCSPS